MKQNLDTNPSLNFKDKTFDVVIALDVLEHLNLRHDILEELKRVAKDDALFIIALPNDFSYQAVWYHIKGVNWVSGDDWGHKYLYDLKTAKEYLSKHLKVNKAHYLYLDGRLAPLGKLNQFLARKMPRWFARNMIFECTK